MSMSQSKSVINFVVNYCNEHYEECEEFKTIYNDVLNDVDRNVVVDFVVNGIKSGEISMTEKSKEKFNKDSLLRRYVVGLVNDRLRKSKSLNGSKTYVPAFKRDKKDVQLETLKQVLLLNVDNEHTIEIERCIEVRRKELNVVKVKEVEIDYSALPKDLQHLKK